MSPQAPPLATFDQSAEGFRYLRAPMSSLVSNVCQGGGGGEDRRCWDVAVGNQNNFFYKELADAP